MGYFSNGTESLDYEERYCVKCLHFNGCAVWRAHLIHNYDEANNKNSILHELIPLDDLSNGKCKMYISG